MQDKKTNENKGNILVVDDEYSIRELLRKFLSLQGYEVETANDGVDALEKVFHSLPNLIILDIMMPGMDGLEVCKKLRQNERTKSIPILIITGLFSQDIIRQAIEFNVVDVLNKPFSLYKLLDTVQNVLDQSLNRPIIKELVW